MSAVELRTAQDILAHYKAVSDRLSRPSTEPISAAPQLPAETVCSMPVDDVEHEQERDQLPASALDIRRAVSRALNVPLFEINSRRRSSQHCRARRVITALCKEMTNLSFGQISSFIGGRQNKSMIYGQGVFKIEVQGDPEFAAIVDEIRSQFKSVKAGA